MKQFQPPLPPFCVFIAENLFEAEVEGGAKLVS